MTRRKFTSKFKTKVVLEALKERQTVKELAQKFEITPQQIGTWKRDFLKEADTVFSKGEKSKKSEAEEKKDQLLKVIGELKVENDFLKNALR
ncbi:MULTISPECIES: transposase [Salegentibacter]|jgi:transposase|uniref:Transposase n=3 Tax=Salegentibacter salarius TaxID=435906 RepID=A0A2N0TNQ1_9FLAO|nr:MULTISPECIES: transposase [Salegentibacter]OEY71592.1 transposase [Salegentibacter salarius]PKD16381.1 transposase [Salegentibacter salarius]TDN79071.1 transposase [Salegentibacter sp. 24]SLJ96594.1 transposase [Salegentibacter salarius]SLJ96784.1 transposase [Salegentibacter salarius]|tara:strand:- start:318 stop:593 length:276 start_codon:yes stop_codon:yes gene_type:complete